MAVTAVILMAEALVACGDTCQFIWTGEGGVESSPASVVVVALAVTEALFMLPAASRARTV